MVQRAHDDADGMAAADGVARGLEVVEVQLVAAELDGFHGLVVDAVDSVVDGRLVNFVAGFELDSFVRCRVRDVVGVAKA